MTRPCAVCGLSEDVHDGTEFHRFQESFPSTRRDVEVAIDLQEHEDLHNEDFLSDTLTVRYGWNSNHAREIAELAWTHLYAEKEGE